MKLVFLKYWDRVRSGFWFLPAMMAAVAVLLSYATVALDETLVARGAHVWSWVYTGGAEGASAVLTAISGSMITIAGLVFSMTLVAMSLAASNFGPRLLQNFMRDTANQVVLGVFVATFLYCLLVLRTIRRADEGVFVPHVSVSLGVLFAIASLSVLIYFIHHVSVSIQADEIIARVGAELIGRVDSMYPEKIGHSRSQADGHADLAKFQESIDRDSCEVVSRADGYLQLVDAGVLMKIASDRDAIFRLERRPGDYVVAGRPLLRMSPAGCLDDELVRAVNSAFALGDQRTAAQDIEYPIGQLVEIAVRALSPGINDPFTAMTCVDRLSSTLSRLAQRKMPSSFRYDEQGVLRVLAPSVTFAALVDAAFNPIRRYGGGSAEVTIRLLDAIAVLAQVVRSDEDRAVLRRHAAMIKRGAMLALRERCDLREIGRRYDRLKRSLRVSAALRARSASPANAARL